MPDPTPKARPVLVADGWRKRAGNVYTRPVAPGVLGWLSLATDRGLPHQWRLAPSIGVVHERVEAVARALTGAVVVSPNLQATVSVPLLGLVEGEADSARRHWLIAAEALDGNERVFEDVATTARAAGLPWVQARTSLQAVVSELRAGRGPWRRTPLLTAALWLAGDAEAAESWLSGVEAQFDRPTPAPDLPAELKGHRVTRVGAVAPPEGWPRSSFEAFAARLRRGLDEHPGGPPEGWQPPVADRA
ncbi:hypothetical protein [Intrasporangium flavum]|uniref:hypothetical protein n=1 Tax=Intrasporangium flavum TaxID=1428657 RepID=UPI00096C5113|nr:hypothetical protein [Intrasporangium flavum]